VIDDYHSVGVAAAKTARTKPPIDARQSLRESWKSWVIMDGEPGSDEGTAPAGNSN
jgi:hypothetical protein